MPRRLNSNASTNSYQKPTNRKKKKSNKKTQARKGSRKREHDQLCKEITMRVNPFHAEACCPCIDSNTMRSIPITLRTRIPVSSQNTGHFVYRIHPKIYNSYQVATIYSTDTVTTWGSGSNMPGAAAALEKVRINQIGVRYFASSTPDNSAGMVGIVKGSFIDGFNTASDLYEDITVCRQYEADLSTTAHPQGDKSREFFDWDDSSITEDDGWPTIYVFGTGLALTTAVGYIELTYQVEALPTLTALYAQMTVPPGPNVPALEGVISNVRSKIPTVVGEPSDFAKVVEGVVAGQVSNFMSSIAPAALEGMLALL